MNDFSLRGASELPGHIGKLVVAIGYLFAIGLSEILTVLGNPRVGLVFYSLILLGLFFHAAFGKGDKVRRFCLALTLVPLIRIVSLSMPLGEFHPLIWYLLAVVPLFVGTILVIYYLALLPAQVGLGFGKGLVAVLGHFSVTLTGFLFGFVGYHILKPFPLVSSSTPIQLIIAVLVLLFGIGFIEELIFRGILLHTSREVLGEWAGLFYVSALFGVLQLGYLSWSHALSAISAGLLFGWIVLRTRTIYSVGLAHGFTNIAVFLLASLQFSG